MFSKQTIVLWVDELIYTKSAVEAQIKAHEKAAKDWTDKGGDSHLNDVYENANGILRRALKTLEQAIAKDLAERQEG